MIQPQNDRVLIQRIEDVPRGTILLTDRSKSIKGLVLAVGPGKWIEGTWWKTRPRFISGVERGNIDLLSQWEWIPGHRERLAVKPGMKMRFNSQWNDLAAGQN